MSDIKLFRTGPQGVAELKGQSLALERSLQALMEKNLETLLGVRFLASEYSTGAKHKGRIDTLGIDENRCPVIIEYKRTTNENVISQGLFYLDWLMDHQAEFKLLVLDKLGKKEADGIEWSGPRLLCIAGDFTRYDEHAVRQMNRNIELIRYRHFPDGFLILERVNSVSAETIPVGPKEITAKHYKSVSEHLAQAPEALKELYHALEDTLQGLGDDVEKKVVKCYIAFKRIKNFACVEVRVKEQRLLVYVKCPATPENLIEGFTRDLSNIGHFGTGDFEITIRNRDDLSRAQRFFELSYQEN
ncbi:MAG TPA: DUF5655 domain-containing protein [Humidesulfovibrio sp.]|uniref:DUF5655 domain-containing protein n=1 Tax=Humidesulfovibrio sp. TaxID=2910988 RepID=UPI002CE2644E|nr:DUF5655 domain-containing protein [Humidesulfovibrio sp.]HWR03799.1 DUF5655 domain-containing protein [Humidesulfovibrio sp.]